MPRRRLARKVAAVVAARLRPPAAPRTRRSPWESCSLLPDGGDERLDVGLGRLVGDDLAIADLAVGPDDPDAAREEAGLLHLESPGATEVSTPVVRPHEGLRHRLLDEALLRERQV